MLCKKALNNALITILFIINLIFFAGFLVIQAMVANAGIVTALGAPIVVAIAWVVMLLARTMLNNSIDMQMIQKCALGSDCGAEYDAFILARQNTLTAMQYAAIALMVAIPFAGIPFAGISALTVAISLCAVCFIFATLMLIRLIALRNCIL